MVEKENFKQIINENVKILKLRKLFGDLTKVLLIKLINTNYNQPII